MASRTGSSLVFPAWFGAKIGRMHSLDDVVDLGD